jgi:hypothetical protein
MVPASVLTEWAYTPASLQTTGKRLSRQAYRKVRAYVAATYYQMSPISMKKTKKMLTLSDYPRRNRHAIPNVDG